MKFRHTNFGAVPVGESASRIITIDNRDNRGLLFIPLRGQDVVGSGFSFGAHNTCLGTFLGPNFGPGETCEAEVIFRPLEVGPASAVYCLTDSVCTELRGRGR